MSSFGNLSIAITDRNPHVRELVCRELSELGLPVRPLAGAENILAALNAPQPPQVLVLDPEAATEKLPELARRVAAERDRVAVVLHVFEGAEAPEGFAGAVVVEKRPDMGPLKAALVALAAGRAPDGGRS